MSLNYRDKLTIEGIFFPNLAFPFVPASDASGEVVAIGADVNRFAVGDRVMSHFFSKWIDGSAGAEEFASSLGGPLAGVLSEYVLLNEESAVKTPAYLSDAEAATLPIAALTAWFALIENGRLKGGETVLVQGTGGVSLFAAQIAAAMNARVIITSGSDRKLERAQHLGFLEGINYRTRSDWEQIVLDLTSGRGVDHLINTAGGESLKKSVTALAYDGHIALIGFLEGSTATIEILPLMVKRSHLHGVTVGHRRAFEAMNRALERFQLKPIIDGVYSFDEASAAFEHLSKGAFGKIVISCQQDSQA